MKLVNLILDHLPDWLLAKAAVLAEQRLLAAGAAATIELAAYRASHNEEFSTYTRQDGREQAERMTLAPLAEVERKAKVIRLARDIDRCGMNPDDAYQQLYRLNKRAAMPENGEAHSFFGVNTALNDLVKGDPRP